MKIPYTELKNRIIKKSENDLRRHKTHCAFYNRDYCSHYLVKCPGSSNCIKYKPIENSNDNKNRSLTIKHNQIEIEKKKCKSVHLNNPRNCTIILHIDEFRMNQIKTIINKYGQYHLRINLRNAKEFNATMSKLKITQIYIEFNSAYIPCYFIRKDVLIKINEDSIVIETNIEGFLNNVPISKRCYRIWYENDLLLGDIEILLNPFNKEKRKKIESH